MRLSVLLTGLALLGSLAACSDVNTTASGRQAGGTSSTAPGATSQMPQPTNSLPQGATVNAPVANGAGVVGATRR